MTKVYFYAPGEREKRLLNTQEPNSFLGIHDHFSGEIATSYFYLKKAGLDCEVVDTIPEEGIVFGDRKSFNLEKKLIGVGRFYKYPGNAMLIVMKSDLDYYPPAHINIVCNPVDFEKNRHSIWNPYCLVSLWPQPGLIPRLKERDCLVENVAYLGHQSQLAKELTSDKWRDALSSLGCKWLPILESKKWNDYSNIDVVIIARSFDGNPYINKPANKLINCWRTGVPAIVTPESSMLAERKSDLDFLLANSLDEAISAVSKLKNSPDLYAKMASNGLERAKDFTVEKGCEKFMKFFEEFVFPTYEKWSLLTENQRKTLFWRRYFKLKSDNLKNRIVNFIGSSSRLSI
jgi:glycosyltransferase involved in cell wall biosynthesis